MKTTKPELRRLVGPIGQGLTLMLPEDVAFVVVLGVKGSGEHVSVSNIPADLTRAWLAEASGAEAEVSVVR